MKKAKRVEMLRDRRKDLKSATGALAVKLLCERYRGEAERPETESAPPDFKMIAISAMQAASLVDALDALTTLEPDDAVEFLEPMVLAIEDTLAAMFDRQSAASWSPVGRALAAARALTAALGYRGEWRFAVKNCSPFDEDQGAPA